MAASRRRRRRFGRSARSTARAPIVLATVRGSTAHRSPHGRRSLSGGWFEKPKKSTRCSHLASAHELHGLRSQSAAGRSRPPTISDVLRSLLKRLRHHQTLRRWLAPWTLASHRQACTRHARRRLSSSRPAAPTSLASSARGMGDPAALEHAAVLARDGDGKAPAPTRGWRWQLSDSALARINAALPDDVVVFCTRAGQVRRARPGASRVYESGAGRRGAAGRRLHRARHRTVDEPASRGAPDAQLAAGLQVARGGGAYTTERVTSGRSAHPHPHHERVPLVITCRVLTRAISGRLPC